MEQIEYLLTQSQTTGCYFQADRELPGAYWLDWNNQRFHVTFSPKVFDEHPDTVRFLTYGSALFADILSSIPEPEPAESGALVSCRISDEFDLRGWYVADSTGTFSQDLTGFQALKDWLTDSRESPGLSAGSLGAVQTHLKDNHDALSKKHTEIIQLRQKAEYLTWRVKAQTLLLHAAMVEIALGRSPEMFETEVFPSTFSEASVLGLQRHGFPWRSLLSLAYDTGVKPEETDPYFIRISTDTRESLKGRFNQLTQEARRLVKMLHDARQAMEDGQPAGEIQVDWNYYG